MDPKSRAQRVQALGVAGFGWWVGIVEACVRSHTGTEQRSTKQRDGITVPTDMGTTQPPLSPRLVSAGLVHS